MGDLAKLKDLELDAYVKRWSRYVRQCPWGAGSTTASAALHRATVVWAGTLLCQQPRHVLPLLQDANEVKDKLTGSSRAVIVSCADGLLHQVGTPQQQQSPAACFLGAMHVHTAASSKRLITCCDTAYCHYCYAG